MNPRKSQYLKTICLQTVLFLFFVPISFGTQTQWIKLKTTAGQEIKLETAITPDEKAKGLSLRRSLPPNTGMIFLYETERPLSFWMKDCLMALDIIWVNSDQKVVHIDADIKPEKFGTPTDQLKKYNQKARMVVELAAGEAKRQGIKVGEKLQLGPLP